MFSVVIDETSAIVALILLSILFLLLIAGVYISLRTFLSNCLFYLRERRRNRKD